MKSDIGVEIFSLPSEEMKAHFFRLQNIKEILRGSQVLNFDLASDQYPARFMLQSVIKKAAGLNNMKPRAVIKRMHARCLKCLVRFRAL
ncbi:MAG: hypothetical protein HUJ51_00845 [Eggerthellaceae bacterium]|nr:hypothetical protein [Eggerthellaceae bacterium]